MSFELLGYIRELQGKVGVLQEQVKQLMLAQSKSTLTLPIKEPRSKAN